jgi:hypothetical protein
VWKIGAGIRKARTSPGGARQGAKTAQLVRRGVEPRWRHSPADQRRAADFNKSTLDKCFEIIGEKPVKLPGRLHDVFVEDFKKELAQISVTRSETALRHGESSALDSHADR